MSAARRLSVVLLLVLTTLALTAASVWAQASPPNPSGGTSCHQAIGEGGGTAATVGFRTSGLPIEYRLSAWITTAVASRHVGSAAARPNAGPRATLQRRISEK